MVKTNLLIDLELSVRSWHCLNSSGIKTIDQLLLLPDAELIKIRNLGRKSYDEILEKLKIWKENDGEGEKTCKNSSSKED